VFTCDMTRNVTLIAAGGLFGFIAAASFAIGWLWPSLF
jgi:hypothetical protein